MTDLRDWKTLLSKSNLELSTSALFKTGRVLSAQPNGMSSFLTPDQMSSAAYKFRLPSIDGGGKPLLSWKHQFRASASLDNRKLLAE
jgi:hypothetical protein